MIRTWFINFVYLLTAVVIIITVSALVVEVALKYSFWVLPVASVLFIAAVAAFATWVQR